LFIPHSPFLWVFYTTGIEKKDALVQYQPENEFINRKMNLSTGK